MTARVLMIALDGADAALLERWSNEGLLPNLAALRAGGATQWLKSYDGVTDDAFWASFQYACGVADHGRYHYLTRRPSGGFGMGYEVEGARDRFWDRLSTAGLRVAVLDVPKCGPPRELNGRHLADWLVHGRYFPEPLSYPAPLAAEVAARFGARPAHCCNEEEPAPQGAAAAALEASLLATADRKVALGLDWLNAEAWDLYIIGFKEAHCGGHAFYDPAAAQGAPTPGPLMRVLQRIDAAIGDLAEAAGPGASVVVFSSTEMDANTTLAHLVGEAARRVNAQLAGDLLSRGRRWLQRHAGKPVRYPCEVLPYGENATALRINGPHADRVAGFWRELADAQSGEAVVAAIDRPSRDEAGALAAALPDLLIRYRAGMRPSAVRSDRLGLIEGTPPALRPGNHTRGRGFCVLSGAAANETVGGVEDLGPLATRLLNAAARPPARTTEASFQ